MKLQEAISMPGTYQTPLNAIKNGRKPRKYARKNSTNLAEIEIGGSLADMRI